VRMFKDSDSCLIVEILFSGTAQTFPNTSKLVELSMIDLCKYIISLNALKRSVPMIGMAATRKFQKMNLNLINGVLNLE